MRRKGQEVDFRVNRPGRLQGKRRFPSHRYRLLRSVKSQRAAKGERDRKRGGGGIKGENIGLRVKVTLELEGLEPGRTEKGLFGQGGHPCRQGREHIYQRGVQRGGKKSAQGKGGKVWRGRRKSTERQAEGTGARNLDRTGAEMEGYEKGVGSGGG